ncbi:hypothetical protein GCM10020358_19540 [Amorphoplanes nipponensis]|uniref:Uncharacterized protein n=1 Tax=Actinoplanes nipponensis TaxID=135950 RepID=A0A919JD99_9ACTN|nr:hypothetical protein [Actinoplanes nipponensis]GIE46797.1 hypothetical protein Ani05nite_03310 [Actinoplanes nipponensis]
METGHPQPAGPAVAAPGVPTRPFLTLADIADIARAFKGVDPAFFLPLAEAPIVLLQSSAGRGRGSSAVSLMDSFYRLLTRIDTGPDLWIGTSRFAVRTDPQGHRFLADDSGKRYAPDRSFSVLRASGTGSVLHPLSAIERQAGVQDVDVVRPAPPEAPGGARRLLQRAAARLNRQLQRASEPLTFASLWRRLIRAAVSVLRQLLHRQRRCHTETPEAVTHSHTVDQHRTRGPNPARTTSPHMVIREPTPV